MLLQDKFTLILGYKIIETALILILSLIFQINRDVEKVILGNLIIFAISIIPTILIIN